MTTQTATIDVPGATLYYEVQGSGPVLLLICGGVYDAAGYAGLAQQLTDRYTVVTYDRRGNSRSPLHGPPDDQCIEVHADDAYRLLTAVGVTATQPAYVFGNGSGAVIGFELAIRHPDLVRTLVAHEPPLFELLPDRDRYRDLITQVGEVLRTDGPGAAMDVLGTGLQMRGGEPGDNGEHERLPGGEGASVGAPDPAMAEMMARLERNMTFFISYEVPPFSRYVPDLDALGATSVRVVAAASGQLRGAQRCYRAVSRPTRWADRRHRRDDPLQNEHSAPSRSRAWYGSVVLDVHRLAFGDGPGRV